MAKQTISVELDEETVRNLAVLGKPIEVLSRLASSAADGVSRDHPRRDQTDVSLRTERDKADDRDADKHEALARAADEVVRIARDLADQLVQAARDEADDVSRPRTMAARDRADRERTRADGVLENERSTADATLEDERARGRRSRANMLIVERDTTDKDLTGERVNVDTLIVDLREANEQLVNATLAAQDLTTEAESAKARAEQSEQELRAVAEFRELFIGILGHDLRTPLQSIVMSTGLLLQRGHLDEHDSVTVARIIRNSQRMTQMIAQLLDFTRARLGGGFPIQPEPTDLRELCKNVIEEFEAPIQLDVTGDVKGSWDPDRLAQVLSNIVGNATEYCARGAVVIVKGYPEGTGVVVEISNQGDPIPADVLPFIFEPFRRAKQREYSVPGNLGLGLYIAHEIVVSHGGTLDAHSADGTTTFVVRLPRHPPTAP
jgi:signal transduction histidine kinase